MPFFLTHNFRGFSVYVIHNWLYHKILSWLLIVLRWLQKAIKLTISEIEDIGAIIFLNTWIIILLSWQVIEGFWSLLPLLECQKIGQKFSIFYQIWSLILKSSCLIASLSVTKRTYKLLSIWNCSFLKLLVIVIRRWSYCNSSQFSPTLYSWTLSEIFNLSFFARWIINYILWIFILLIIIIMVLFFLILKLIC